MSAKHLREDPHKVHQNCWWYEENKGIFIVVEHTDIHGLRLHTQVYNIPWKSLRAALKRKDMKP